MSHFTPCGIAMEREDGTVAGILVFNHLGPEKLTAGTDPALDWTTAHFLQRDFGTAANVAKLVSLGHAAGIYDFDDWGQAHTGKKRPEGWSVVYVNDRGNVEPGPTITADVEGFRAALRPARVEFFYLFAGGSWSVSRPYGRWKPLADAQARGAGILDEPDPDRGPDVQFAPNDEGWVVIPASPVGRQWLEEIENVDDVLELDADTLEITLARMRQDGLIVEQWEPTP